MSVTRRQFAILGLLIFIAGIAAGWGFIVKHSAQGTITDFEVVYRGARCLVGHCDPYNGAEVIQRYVAEGGKLGPANNNGRNTQQTVALQSYLPTASIYFAPFALLSWPTAYASWIALTLCGMIIAAFLTWDLGQEYAPDLTFYLVCILLANCGILFCGGNPAGICVSLCVISVWCLVRDRWVAVGLVSMAISLAIKPHDTGLIWLYFLSSGGVYRKRALQILAITCILGVPAILWISRISPHWTQELHATLVAYSARGGINDPGPAGTSGVGPGMIINLQTIVSLFRDDPGFYNPVSYLLCAPLLLIWIVLTFRSRRSPATAWLALASVTALSMLPLYHRPYDAKLLLLTIPACAMLWKAGGPIGWIAVLMTWAGVLATADIPLAVFQILTRGMHFSPGLQGKILALPLTRPAPLILFAVGLFYLCVYARRHSNGAETVPRGSG